MSDRIVIKRDDLFTRAIDGELARQRNLRGRRVVAPPPVSKWRALLMSSTFQLPLAGALASLLAWAILEPRFDDLPQVGGVVTVVNPSPFLVDESLGPARSLTIGNVEVVVVDQGARFERGASGEPAISGIDAIDVGDIVEAAGEPIGSNRMIAFSLRSASPRHAAATGSDLAEGGGIAKFLFFPLTTVLIAFALLLADGMSTRNWVRMAERMGVGLLLTVVFSLLAFIPSGLVLAAGHALLDANEQAQSIQDLGPWTFITFSASRSLAWAILAASAMFGLHLVRSTALQLRNAVAGGAMGGALGGLFFDPIDRFFGSASAFRGAEVSRLVGLVAVGACVGLFVALVDRLAREAWVLVRTGPLAGKAFVLYRSPTVIGSAPASDIYLFKDAEIDPTHARLHRVGNKYEIEDAGSRVGTHVAGQPVRRQRLQSGDQIVLGGTVLEFEERRAPGGNDA